jgi:hypothetical protein
MDKIFEDVINGTATTEELKESAEFFKALADANDATLLEFLSHDI